VKFTVKTPKSLISVETSSIDVDVAGFYDTTHQKLSIDSMYYNGIDIFHKIEFCEFLDIFSAIQSELIRQHQSSLSLQEAAHHIQSD